MWLAYVTSATLPCGFAGECTLGSFILSKRIKPHCWLYRAISVFYFDIWACNSKSTYKIIFIMTRNWHRRFWRIFYLPFPRLQSTWGIRLYEVEHFELPGSALSMWQVYFSQLSLVTDTTIVSPLPPPTLHCAAEWTVVGFVGLSAGPCLKCTQQFSLICWISIIREVLGSVRTGSSCWYLLSWRFLLYPSYDWVFVKSERMEKERTALGE